MKDSIKVWLVSLGSITFSELNIEHTLQLLILLVSVLFTVYKFIVSQKSTNKVDKLINDEKICIGCNTLRSKPLDSKYLACCPDNHYISLKEYIKRSSIK